MEFIQVLQNVFNPAGIAMIFAGVIMGTIFGCIPGLSTPIALALILPVIFKMDTALSICLMMGIYCGGVSGGLVSAILLKIPGSSAAVATTFDGYPMAQKGYGAEALSIGVFASFFGGTLSCLLLLIMAPTLAKLALQFGPWEYFGTALMALTLSTVLMKGNMIKGLISMCLGVLLTCVGMSPIDGVATRFTFGTITLKSGFEMIALVIGIFAMPEILKNTGKITQKAKLIKIKKKIFYILPLSDIKKYFITMLRNGLLGTVIGILPGLGGGPACLMSYAMEKRLSKEPETFGTGNPKGIAAPESANNATVGGALIPMLSLGVPGDTNTSIILGAFTLLGISTGPIMLSNSPVVFRTTILAVLAANFIMLLVQSLSIPYLAKMLSVPKTYLLPIITVFCVTGCISLKNNMFEVYCMLIFMFIGYLLDNNGYPVAPLIIGFVLGGTVETNLRRAITYYGSFSHCLIKPSIGTLFFAIAILFPAITAISEFIQSRKRVERR